jgi:hypothetical protein
MEDPVESSIVEWQLRWLLRDVNQTTVLELPKKIVSKRVYLSLQCAETMKIEMLATELRERSLVVQNCLQNLEYQ